MLVYIAYFIFQVHHKYLKIKQYHLCWIFVQVHNKMNKFQSNNIIKVTNNRFPAHSGLRHFCNNCVVLYPLKALYELFKNTISYGQAREPTYVLFSLLINLAEMFPKNNSQKNKTMQYAYSNEVYVKSPSATVMNIMF